MEHVNNEESKKRSRAPITTTELTKEEKESVLRALGYYQIRLFDEMRNTGQKESQLNSNSEAENITSAIKKIHKSLDGKLEA